MLKLRSSSSSRKAEEPTSKTGGIQGFAAGVCQSLGYRMAEEAVKVPEVKNACRDLSLITTTVVAGVGLMTVWSLAAVGYYVADFFRGRKGNTRGGGERPAGQGMRPGPEANPGSGTQPV